MEFTSPSDPSKKYLTAGPIFSDGEIVGVLEGKYVLGSVTINRVTAARLDRRSTFNHPWIGLALATVLIGIPVLSYFGDPAGKGWAALGARFGCIGSVFMFAAGAYVLWGVARRRDVPWLVFTTQGGERAYPLDGPLSAEASTFLRSLLGDRLQPGQCAACGYDLRGTPERCPECGTVAVPAP